jgi:hypothetical protein
MEREEKQVRAMIAFVDITGFGSFYDRVENPQIELLPFYRNYQAIVNQFEKNTGTFIKRLGDGFMSICELDEDNKKAMLFLENLWKTMLAIDSLIKNKSTPRPDGVRVRKACGYVWKINDRDEFDYLSSRIHLTEQMVDIERDIQFIMHESAKEIYGLEDLKKAGFRLTKLDLPERIMKNIRVEYRKEMREIWLVNGSDRRLS